MITTTQQALEAITDDGLFERIATVVLQISDYPQLIHVGINAQGKTVPSPIDGIAFVGSANDHVLLVPTLRSRCISLRESGSAIRRKRNGQNQVPSGHTVIWSCRGTGTSVAKLIDRIEGRESDLPDAARLTLSVLVDTLRSLEDRIGLLDEEITRRAREDEDVRRLQTIPGVGPITATALSALAPNAAAFAKGRDFAAWLGLTPLQRSTGGRQKLGATSKMGERTLRRLLIIGASAVVRHAARRGAELRTVRGSGA